MIACFERQKVTIRVHIDIHKWTSSCFNAMDAIKHNRLRIDTV